MDAVEIQQALVASRLAGDGDVAAFCRFVRDARRLSQRHQVAGALLFDGETSLHLIEGADTALRDFMAEVYGQAPQQLVRMVACPSPGPALLPPRWRAGYVEPQSLETWCSSPTGPGAADAAIQRFLALLAQADCA